MIKTRLAVNRDKPGIHVGFLPEIEGLDYHLTIMASVLQSKSTGL